MKTESEIRRAYRLAAKAREYLHASGREAGIQEYGEFAYYGRCCESAVLEQALAWVLQLGDYAGTFDRYVEQLGAVEYALDEQIDKARL